MERRFCVGVFVKEGQKCVIPSHRLLPQLAVPPTGHYWLKYSDDNKYYKFHVYESFRTRAEACAAEEKIPDEEKISCCAYVGIDPLEDPPVYGHFTPRNAPEAFENGSNSVTCSSAMAPPPIAEEQW